MRRRGALRLSEDLFRHVVGLPPDTVINGVEWRPGASELLVHLEHPDLPETPSGGQPVDVILVLKHEPGGSVTSSFQAP